jgi:hypothetical protein
MYCASEKKKCVHEYLEHRKVILRTSANIKTEQSFNIGNFNFNHVTQLVAKVNSILKKV